MMSKEIDGAGCAIWAAILFAALVIVALLVAGTVGLVKLVIGWAVNR